MTIPFSKEPSSPSGCARGPRLAPVLGSAAAMFRPQHAGLMEPLAVAPGRRVNCGQSLLNAMCPNEATEVTNLPKRPPGWDSLSFQGCWPCGYLAKTLSLAVKHTLGNFTPHVTYLTCLFLKAWLHISCLTLKLFPSNGVGFGLRFCSPGAFEVFLECWGVHSGRHQHQPKIRALIQQTSQQGQQEICMQTSLVHFIHHDVAGTFESWIALHDFQQNPHGTEDHLTALGDFILAMHGTSSLSRLTLYVKNLKNYSYNLRHIFA